MKKLLVIGAGWEQEALVKEAKKQGHYIIATHPSINTDGFKYADVTFVKNSLDINSHLHIARTYEVDGVLTDNCDFSLYTASVVSKALGLKFNDIRSALYSNNKFAQREACDRSGILQPVFRKVQTNEELEVAVAEIGFPLIIKPVDSRGTFGVTIVGSQENLASAFFEALSHSASHTTICEKYISGTLVTVDGFVFKNGHQSLAVASRTFQSGSKPVTREIIYPARFEDDLNIRLMKNHHHVVQALEYHQGHTHGEYLVTDQGEIYLVECANRGGGVYTSSTIVPSLTGLNLNEILINQSLGIDEFSLSQSGLELMRKSAILTFLDLEVGRVIKGVNLAEMQTQPYVLNFRMIFGENDMVESIENCASRHSMLAITGKDEEESMGNLEHFKTNFSVEYY